MTGYGSAQPYHYNQCWPAVPWDTSKTPKIFEHIAAHLLFDNSVDTSQELCGLCMRPSPLCIFYLWKGKGTGPTLQIDLCTSCCPNLVGRFLYTAASTEWTNSPCTNVLVTCPLCPSTSESVWKYNMRTHLMKNHPSVCDTDILKDYTVSRSEKAALKLRWDKCHKVKSHRKWCNVTQVSTPLTISDVHSSHQALL